jgi:hypothetical protein
MFSNAPQKKAYSLYPVSSCAAKIAFAAGLMAASACPRTRAKKASESSLLFLKYTRER